MMGLLYTFGIFVSINIALSILMRKNFEIMLPVVFFSIIVLSYLMAMMQILHLLTPVMISITLGLLILLIVRTSKEKNAVKYAQDYIFTPGFFLFLCLSALCVIHNYGRLFTLWDEFSHWGLVAKNMYLLDGFAIGDKATTVFQDYPPAMGLFQYFFSRFDPIFIESRAIQANAIFSAGILTAILPRFTIKLKFRLALLLYLFYQILIAIYPAYFSQLYVDGVLSLLFAYLLIRIYEASTFDTYLFIELLMGSIVLVLVKDTGFYLALFTTLLLLVKFTSKSWKGWIGLFSAVILTKMSWAWISADVGKHFNVASIRLPEFIDFFIGRAPEYRYQTLQNFLSTISLKPMFIFGRDTIPLSYLGFVLLLYILIIGALKATSPKEKKSMMQVSTIVFAGFFLYAFALLMMYVFTFSEYEAVRVASLSRYIGTYCLGFALFAMHLVAKTTEASITHLWYERKYFVHKFVIIIVALTFIAISMRNFQVYVSGWRHSHTVRAPYSDIQRYQNILHPASRVYLISQHSKGYDYWVLRYNLTLAKTQGGFGSWSLGGAYDGDDIWFRDINAMKWKEDLISSYDFVYLFQPDDRFIANFSDLFESKESIKKRSMYRVIKETQGPTLILVEMTE